MNHKRSEWFVKLNLERSEGFKGRGLNKIFTTSARKGPLDCSKRIRRVAFNLMQILSCFRRYTRKAQLVGKIDFKMINIE